jgi:hypothetical protein
MCRKKEKTMKQSIRSSALVIAVIAAVVGGAFTIWAKRVPEKKPDAAPSDTKGRILQPQANTVVGRSFTVSGEHIDLPKDYHVWLAVEIGTLLWPKEPEVPTADKKWSVKVVEGGNPPGGLFSLSLFQVSPEGNQFIVRWHKHGQRTGDFPGLNASEIPGFSRLDIVENLRLQ